MMAVLAFNELRFVLKNVLMNRLLISFKNKNKQMARMAIHLEELAT